MLFYQTFVLALATVAPVLALPALRRDEALAIAADSALLNHKQQDAAYKMRANLQKWRDEITLLDSKGQKEAVKELNSFTKKVAHIQHVQYIEYQSPDLLFAELNKMAWDENMARMALGWWHNWQLKHATKKVDKKIDHALDHHHVRSSTVEPEQTNVFKVMIDHIKELDEHLSLKPKDEKKFRKELVESLHDLGYENKNHWQDDSTKAITLEVLGKSDTVFQQLSSDEAAEVLKNFSKATAILDAAKAYNGAPATIAA